MTIYNSFYRTKIDRLNDLTDEEIVRRAEERLRIINEKKPEEQKQPKHYDLTIQPIDYIVANKLNFAEGNIIKYVSRYKLKNGKEDLLKARYYLDLLIKQFDKK